MNVEIKTQNFVYYLSNKCTYRVLQSVICMPKSTLGN